MLSFFCLLCPTNHWIWESVKIFHCVYSTEPLLKLILVNLEHLRMHFDDKLCWCFVSPNALF